MYQGFYINLDCNKERRAALERQLETLGVAERYRRIAAVDGRAVAQQYTTSLAPGNLGLWLSHARVLEACGEASVHLHVIEDDAVLVRTAASQFDLMLQQADAKVGDWDVIFTDIIVTTSPWQFLLLENAMRVFEQSGQHSMISMQENSFAGTSSIFINRKSLTRWAEFISSGCRQGLPIDICLRELMQKGQLKAYLTVPFMTSVSRDSLRSDIAGEVASKQALTTAVLTAYRRAFFEGADLLALDAEIQELTQHLGPLSRLAVLYLRTLRFMLSDQWVSI